MSCLFGPLSGKSVQKARNGELFGIEKLHHNSDTLCIKIAVQLCLDVTFREDRSRMRKDNTAENFAVVRHIVLNILKRMDDKMSVARRRRHCAYDDDCLEKVMRSIHA